MAVKIGQVVMYLVPEGGIFNRGGAVRPAIVQGIWEEGRCDLAVFTNPAETGGAAVVFVAQVTEGNDPGQWSVGGPKTLTEAVKEAQGTPDEGTKGGEVPRGEMKGKR